MTYSSVLSTVRCFAVTSGEREGETFVQWSAHFSSDADAGMWGGILFRRCNLGEGRKADLMCMIGVIEDARFKRKEALADLAKAVKK